MPFMSFRVHFSKLPNFQYLETIFFLYIYCLVCSVILGEKVSPNAVIQSLVKVEVYLFFNSISFYSVLEHVFDFFFL